jgi:hypothetical protein
MNFGPGFNHSAISDKIVLFARETFIMNVDIEKEVVTGIQVLWIL